MPACRAVCKFDIAETLPVAAAIDEDVVRFDICIPALAMKKPAMRILLTGVNDTLCMKNGKRLQHCLRDQFGVGGLEAFLPEFHQCIVLKMLMLSDSVYGYIHRKPGVLHRKHFFENSNRVFDSIARCNRLTKHFFNIDYEKNKLNNQQRRYFFKFMRSNNETKQKKNKQRINKKKTK